MNCRHCSSRLALRLIDLGTAPPSNAYLTAEKLDAPEKWYPLKVLVCERCWLAQTQDFAQADELFADDYAYFSSYSTGWLAHAERYVADTVARFRLDRRSHVVELASNDGYLLQYVQARGIPCTGIEPTASTAAASRSRSIETIQEFFDTGLSERLVAEGKQADLIVANNVLAHVPNINDFIAGVARLLKREGVATFEFPHLMRLMAEIQFDTIYHEHFSYLSFTTVRDICTANGLAVFDVEEISTHGGSLRVYAQRRDTGAQRVGAAVDGLLQRELSEGMRTAAFYEGFQAKAEEVKNAFVSFLIDARRRGKTVAAYGAAAKGSTLLNFAGCRRDLIGFVVDKNPAKQGKFMPGSRIPIVNEEVLYREKSDYIVVLPWNLKAEVIRQLDVVRTWSGKFVTAVPRLEITP